MATRRGQCETERSATSIEVRSEVLNRLQSASSRWRWQAHRTAQGGQTASPIRGSEARPGGAKCRRRRRRRHRHTGTQTHRHTDTGGATLAARHVRLDPPSVLGAGMLDTHSLPASGRSMWMTAACNRVVGLELILTSLKMATARSPAPTRRAAVILDGKFVAGAGAGQGQCSRLAEALRALGCEKSVPRRAGQATDRACRQAVGCEAQSAWGRCWA
jgi:hypothetical protein